VLIDGDAAALHRTPPALPVDLQCQVLVFHGIVAIYCSLGLNGKDAIQILADAWNKCRLAGIVWLDGKLPVELADIFFSQKAVGLIERGYAAYSQLLRQTALPGAKSKYSSRYSLNTSSTTATGLRLGLSFPTRPSCSPSNPISRTLPAIAANADSSSPISQPPQSN